jgi:hypothetical protein
MNCFISLFYNSNLRMLLQNMRNGKQSKFGDESLMVSKSIPDQIFDELAKALAKDKLFNGICDDLLKAIKQPRFNKVSIEKLLQGEKGVENPKSGN